MKNFVASLTLRFLDRLSQPARAATSAIGRIENAQKMGEAASKQWGASLDKLDGQLSRLASASLATDGMGRAGQAMMRPLRSGVAAAAEFNSGMTGIGITAQMTDEQLQPMRKTILQTASDLGELPSVVQGAFASVLAEGVYETEAQLTLAGRSVARFQKLAAKMKDPISGAEAGGLSASLATSFGLSADRLDQANAMLNRSGQQGGVGIGILARFIPEQAATMKGLGGATERGLADLLAANQVSKTSAGSADAGANNLTNLLTAITSPETIRKFDKIGVNLEREIKGGVERGISPLETVATLTKRVTGGDKFRIGELFGDRQASAGIIALVQNIDRFKEQSRELQGDGILQAYYADIERALQGPAASFGRYVSGMERASIATGTILAPAVGAAADVLAKVADWMSTASENGNWLAKAAVWAIAGLAGAAVAAGALGSAVVGILGPLFIAKTMLGPGGLGGAAFKAGAAQVIGLFARMRLAAIGFNFAMLANPVVLIGAAAVAAVVGVALVVRKYWEPIKAFFGGVGEALGEAFGPALSAIGSMLSPLKPLWDGFADGVGKVAGWFGRLLQPVDAADQSVTNAAEAGRKFGRFLADAFQLSPVGLFIRGVRVGFDAIKAIMSWRPMDTLRAAWSGLTGFFGGLQQRFHGFGRMILQGLIAGIRSMLGGVQDAVMNTASSAVNWFKSRLGIRSPSRVFMGLGGDTMAGLTLGLDRGGRTAVQRVAAIGAAVVGAMPVAGAALPAVAQPGAFAPSPAAPTGLRSGGVHIETLTIHVTVQGGAQPGVGRQVGRDIAAELRARLHDES